MNYQQAKTRAEALAIINMAERVVVEFGLAYAPDPVRVNITKVEARRLIDANQLPSEETGAVKIFIRPRFGGVAAISYHT